jgi:hypothetical protein
MQVSSPMNFYLKGVLKNNFNYILKNGRKEPEISKPKPSLKHHTLSV